MTTLTFDLRFGDKSLDELDVPVAVRTTDLLLVGRVGARESLDVEPGTYLVTAQMPAGQKLTQVVEAAGKSLEVVLKSEPQEAERYFAMRRRASGAPEAPTTFTSSLLRGARALVSRLPEAVVRRLALERVTALRGKLRFFSGNLLRQEVGLIPPPSEMRKGEGVYYIDVPPSDVARLVQVKIPDRRPVNIALPSSAQCGCTIVVRHEADRYWVEVHLANREADLLLAYAQNCGIVQEAKVAESLLRRKVDDPVAAAVACYALLRQNDLERLHDWTDNLARTTVLADATAIRGELLARSGRAEEALESFLEVEARGLPAFSEGVRFLFDRLKLYTLPGSLLPGEKLERARTLLNTIEPFVSAMDADKAVTTFAGAIPGRPIEVTAKRLSNEPAIDLGSLE